MGNKSKVYIERTFECGVRTLFEWLTQPDMIAQWFGPAGYMTGEVTNELKVGGRYSIELMREGHAAFIVFGEYIAINVPDTLRFTYGYLGLKNPPPASTVSFNLAEVEPERTNLTMIQHFDAETPDFDTRTRAWDFMFEQLADRVNG